MIADQYADTVPDSRRRMIAAAGKVLAAGELVESARRERDRALAARYFELQDDGLGLAAALAVMRRELHAEFDDRQMSRIGVSAGAIRLAIARYPRG